MQELSTNSVFLFIANLYGWDDTYQQHIIQCYSGYTDVDSALSAICADYNLDMNSIDHASSLEISNPVLHLMTPKMCDRILCLILKSQASPIRRMVHRFRDMSAYKLDYSNNSTYNLVYNDWENGVKQKLGTVEVKLNCLQRAWREEHLHKKGDDYVGWINLYDEDAVILFKLHIFK